MSKLEVTIEEQPNGSAKVFFMGKEIGDFDTVEEANHEYSFAKFLATPKETMAEIVK
jgi:hypothetical protein